MEAQIKEKYAEMALKMALMDAIRTGKTTRESVMDYMKTDACIEASRRYYKLLPLAGRQYEGQTIEQLRQSDRIPRDPGGMISVIVETKYGHTDKWYYGVQFWTPKMIEEDGFYRNSDGTTSFFVEKFYK